MNSRTTLPAPTDKWPEASPELCAERVSTWVDSIAGAACRGALRDAYQGAERASLLANIAVDHRTLRSLFWERMRELPETPAARTTYIVQEVR